MRTATLLALLTFLAWGAPAPAQNPWQKQEDKIVQSACARLMTFARLAERNKVYSRAKEAYELILSLYDPDHAQARRALGYEKKDGVWEEASKPRRWPDDANDELRFEVIGDWKRFAEGLADLHRELGIEMLDDSPARAVFHLRTAIYYNPFDVAAHQALEHEQFEDFWGTPPQVAFVKRMRDLEAHAISLAKRDYEVEPVEELPPELQKMTAEDADTEFHGAKSATFTIYARGQEQTAIDCVKWAERACDFLEYCLPPDVARTVDVRKVLKRSRGWTGFVWTNAEKKAFIRLNPQLKGDPNFVNVHWVENGKINEVVQALTPATMFDFLICDVFEHLGGNNATLEGLRHAATWYLRATAISRRGAYKTGTTTGDDLTLPDSASWWLREIRDQATAKSDFPINQLPRVQMSDFHNDARLKSWSFSVWMLARFPDKWFHLHQKLPDEKERPFPEKVDEIFEEVLGMPRADVEEEWRAWAAGRSLAAYATGYGPPLLPEKPNNEQIDGLVRLNEFRAMLGLPPCEIDLEATLACRDHALFLQQNPDHWTWPEAHEEDPAKPGFTIRGMRAGLRSVIIIGQNEFQKIQAEDSIDGWMGTPYHRFPLLEPNIRRIGFAAEGNVVVLDMGSLEEARTEDHENRFRWTPWPADGMTDVPVAFHATEHPDPLADTPEGRAAEPFALQRNAGYPISLQLARHVATQLDDASFTLYEVTRKGDEVVPCWVHTPKTPLLKRMEMTDVVFAIPKEQLKKRTKYKVLVTLKVLAGEDRVEWSFTTGTRETGHGKLRPPKER